jgi:hypothetical protein
MVRGYHQANERYYAAAAANQSEAAYFALFEALNWAVAVDDVVAEIWRPAGARERYSWRGRVPSADVLPAVRTVRNLIHHHWDNDNGMPAYGGVSRPREGRSAGARLAAVGEQRPRRVYYDTS